MGGPFADLGYEGSRTREAFAAVPLNLAHPYAKASMQ